MKSLLFLFDKKDKTDAEHFVIPYHETATLEYQESRVEININTLLYPSSQKTVLNSVENDQREKTARTIG